MKLANLSKAGGFAAATALLLTACGASNTGGGEAGSGEEAGAPEGGDSSAWGDCTPGATSADATELDPAGGDLTIGAFTGWDESYATAHLLKAVLEEDGYSVTIDSYEAGPGYTGLAEGDIDLLTDTWLPLTHADYIEQFGDDIEAQGCWYDNAVLTFAVNEDSPAQSIADLPDLADEYGNRIVGIEPGAGLTQITQEEVIPTYGLEDYEFITSSTPAMLAELDSAVESGENILVTLWRPHWAYDAWPVRDLEDPEGALGETEVIWNFSRGGFTEDDPYAAQLLNNLVLDDDQLASLQNLMMSDEHYGGEDHDAAVAEWLEDNPEYADQLRAGELG
ncbi:glycine betaine ABC transporter substrate-binding protein [Sediminivirga luteola]|uniref:Glycine/betaine ABC transporter substrate-binding protein n=3 Tax=Sediminivirga luteola TaxID=1774748 RepID=A0A8J2TZ77_9MICO|nr:glycine betaine ABC transporter substrate-binding protein [Sediminivirga luteola]MCI2265004.1 glycine betaine ABC transporter substrate-binding protein [Sediminivirga luteola]GGA19424.1 glycine/betaine ABC transporter substrate-binding protein [Sediminivirga luteola]